MWHDIIVSDQSKEKYQKQYLKLKKSLFEDL